MSEANLAASVRQRLLNQARSQDRPFQELLIYLEAVMLLIAVALAACAIPALRAAYIDPAITLRTE